MGSSESYDDLIGHKATFRLKNEPDKLVGEIQRVDKENSTITFYKVTIIEDGKQPRVLSGLQEYSLNEIRDVNVLDQVNQALKRASLGKEYERNAYPQQKKKRGIRHDKETPKHLENLEEFDSTLLYMMNIVEKAMEKTRDENGQYESQLPPNSTLLADHQSQIFKNAIDFLKKQPYVAVAFEGVNLGRSGQLSWILASTRTHTMFFDIKTMGKDSFDAGLRDFLQYPKTMKVIHDCRRPSDILHHQFETKLINVFDTQVGTVHAFKAKNKNIYPRYVTSLADCLRKELRLDEEEIHVPYLREHNTQQDEEVWCLRPAPSLVYQWMKKHVHHLLDLRDRQMELIMMEFTLGVDIYLKNLRDLYKTEANVRMTMQHLLPSEFSGLPMIVKARLREEQPRQRCERQNSLMRDEQGRIENWAGHFNPNLMGSRDTIWHMKRRQDKPSGQLGDKVKTGTTDRQKGGVSGNGASPSHPFEREAGEDPRTQQQAKDSGRAPASRQQQNGLHPKQAFCHEQQTLSNVSREQRSGSFPDTASYMQGGGEGDSAHRDCDPAPNQQSTPTKTSSGLQMSHFTHTQHGSDNENRHREMTGCSPRHQTQQPDRGERKQSSASLHDSAASSHSESESKQGDYVAKKLMQAVEAHREKEKNTKDIHNMTYVFRPAGELPNDDPKRKKQELDYSSDDLASKKVQHSIVQDPKLENTFDMIPSQSKMTDINCSRNAATTSSFDTTSDHQPLPVGRSFDITTFKEAIPPPPYTVREDTGKDDVQEALAAILPRVQNQSVLLDGSRTSHHTSVAHSQHRGRRSSGDGSALDSGLHSQHRGRSSSGDSGGLDSMPHSQHRGRNSSGDDKAAPCENKSKVSSSAPAQAGRGGSPPVKHEAEQSTPSSHQPAGMFKSHPNGVVTACHISPSSPGLSSASSQAPQAGAGSGSGDQSQSESGKKIAKGKSLISILGFKSPQEVMAKKLKTMQNHTHT